MYVLTYIYLKIVCSKNQGELQTPPPPPVDSALLHRENLVQRTCRVLACTKVSFPGCASPAAADISSSFDVSTASCNLLNCLFVPRSLHQSPCLYQGTGLKFLACTKELKNLAGTKELQSSLLVPTKSQH